MRKCLWSWAMSLTITRPFTRRPMPDATQQHACTCSNVACVVAQNDVNLSSYQHNMKQVQATTLCNITSTSYVPS